MMTTIAILVIGDSLYRGVLAQEVYQFLWSFLDGMGVFLGVIIFSGIVAIEWFIIALPASMSGYIGVWLYQKLPDAKKQYFKKSIRFLCSLLQKATIKIHPPYMMK